MSGDVLHTLGVLASIYLLLLLLGAMLVLAGLLYAAIKMLGFVQRRLEGALRKAQGTTQAIERGTAGAARVAAKPVILGHRVGVSARALWHRATGPVRAWRGAR